MIPGAIQVGGWDRFSLNASGCISSNRPVDLDGDGTQDVILVIGNSLRHDRFVWQGRSDALELRSGG